MSSSEDFDDLTSASEVDDLDQSLETDYAAIPELDSYDAAALATDEVDDRDILKRRLLDLELRAREQPYGEAGLPDFYFPRRQQTMEEDAPLDIESIIRAAQQLPEDYVAFDLAQVKDDVATALRSIQVEKEVERQFRRFLVGFKLPATQEPHYVRAVNSMVQRNETSISIPFTHLTSFSSNSAILARWLIQCPHLIIPIFDRVLRDVVGRDYSRYSTMDLSPLTAHLNKLISVQGVVTRRSTVFPKLRVAVWQCVACGGFTEPSEIVDDLDAAEPDVCPDCAGQNTFRLSKQRSKYSSVQKVDLQESPGAIEAGRAPRSISLILTDDLIDTVRPGQEVTITGIFEAEIELLNKKGGFPVCPTVVHVVAVEDRSGSMSLTDITQEEINMIKRLSRDPNIADRLIKSMASSIYGLTHVKEVLALTLFGGVEKKTERHRSRGDINVLLLGDPSTAKSQCLKFLEKTASRAVFTTGKGASAVGLTACVRRDPQTKLMTLEGGAFVIADRGMCLIDEFDKMSEFDRSAIHEAMEQQTVSVSKAGIVASLNSRCSVVACANPLGGRYDPSRPLISNVDLSEPILSRFDVTIVLRDLVDPFSDAQTAEFVINSHFNLHPNCPEGGDPNFVDKPDDDGVEVIPHELLKKYIRYAKQEVQPLLGSQVKSKNLEDLYTLLRKESNSHGGQVITVRQLESIIRLAEASARMHLRSEVTQDDLKRAVRIVVASFIETQKVSVKRHLQKVFQKYLSDVTSRTGSRSKSSDSAIIFEQLDGFLAKALRDRYTLLEASRLLPVGLQGPLQITISLGEFEKVLKEEGLEAWVGDHGFGESVFRKYLNEIRRRPRKSVNFDGTVFSKNF
ncbi:hypothetical protein GEMRC1_011738 [Eukaryota sp. GEM-RC1]